MGIGCPCEQMGGRKRSTDFRTGESLGPRDHLITYTKPKVKPDWSSQSDYDAAPENLSVRELRVSNGKGGKGRILVCHALEMTAKEIWIYLLAYILIRTLMVQ